MLGREGGFAYQMILCGCTRETATETIRAVKSNLIVIGYDIGGKPGRQGGKPRYKIFKDDFLNHRWKEGKRRIFILIVSYALEIVDFDSQISASKAVIGIWALLTTSYT